MCSSVCVTSPPQELHQLQAMFQRAGPGWKSQLIMGSSAVSDKILFGSCDGDCSWADIPCWVSELECDTSTIVSEIASLGTAIQDVVNEIGDFFVDVVNTTGSLLTEVEDFFTGLWDTVKSGFESILALLLDQIPSSPQEALALIGLDLSANQWAAWWNNFNNAAVTLNTECTALGLGIGADIAGFGEVGSPRAEFVCKRGLMWVDEKVGEVLGRSSVKTATDRTTIFVPRGRTLRSSR